MRYLRVLVACLTALAWGSAGEAGASERIAYAGLSDEGTDRFPVENYPARWRSSYARTARNYASVRDCLKDDEAAKPDPDIRQFDWDKLDTEEIANVCFFRIAMSIGNVDRLRRWFEFHGFGTFVSFDRAAWGTPIYFWAGWAVRSKRRPIKFPTSGFRHWISQYSVAGQDVIIRMNHDKDIIIVRCGYTTE